MTAQQKLFLKIGIGLAIAAGLFIAWKKGLFGAKESASAMGPADPTDAVTQQLMDIFKKYDPAALSWIVPKAKDYMPGGASSGKITDGWKLVNGQVYKGSAMMAAWGDYLGSATPPQAMHDEINAAWNAYKGSSTNW
jgi:hypothetical protein